MGEVEYPALVNCCLVTTIYNYAIALLVIQDYMTPTFTLGTLD